MSTTLAPTPARVAAVFGALGVAAMLVAVVLVRTNGDPVALGAPPLEERGTPRDEAEPSVAVHFGLVVRQMDGPGWRVTDRFVAPGVVVLHVRTDRAQAVEAIARDVMASVDGPHDEVLIYFHRTDQTRASSFARVQWTPSAGYRTWSLE